MSKEKAMEHIDTVASTIIKFLNLNAIPVYDAKKAVDIALEYEDSEAGKIAKHIAMQSEIQNIIRTLFQQIDTAPYTFIDGNKYILLHDIAITKEHLIQKLDEAIAKAESPNNKDTPPNEEQFEKLLGKLVLKGVYVKP